MELPNNEAIRMLVRRGFRPQPSPRDLPFSEKIAEGALAELMGHYGFRLFLRGAISKRDGFRPEEATAYLGPEQAALRARELVRLALLEELPGGRVRLVCPARSFGPTLEWYVGHFLSTVLGFQVATGLKLGAPGVGGDLDVVAAAEGKLLYFELKSSPPRNLEASEVGAFLRRVEAVRPDLAFFVIDTALRLEDKVLPMLLDELERCRDSTEPPERLIREVWRLRRSLFVLNAHRDLLANIRLAVADGLKGLTRSS